MGSRKGLFCREDFGKLFKLGLGIKEKKILYFFFQDLNGMRLTINDGEIIWPGENRCRLKDNR